jgi:hypothetical protein
MHFRVFLAGKRNTDRTRTSETGRWHSLLPRMRRRFIRLPRSCQEDPGSLMTTHILRDARFARVRVKQRTVGLLFLCRGCKSSPRDSGNAIFRATLQPQHPRPETHQTECLHARRYSNETLGSVSQSVKRSLRFAF